MSLEDDFLAKAEGVQSKVVLARTTISLPATMLIQVEDLALHNKRKRLPNRSVSAIVKAALEKTLIS